jgi:hypothetical protein
MCRHFTIWVKTGEKYHISYEDPSVILYSQAMIGFLRQIVFCAKRVLRQKKPFSGAFAKLCRTTISSVMSVRLSVWPSAWNNSASTQWIFMKFDIWVFCENLSRNILRKISGFRCEVDENCTLLGCYAASSGNFLPTFRDNLSVPSSGAQNSKGILDYWTVKMGQRGFPETSAINYHYSLRNNPEERSSNLLRKFKSRKNLTRISSALRENQHTFITISRSALLRMRKFSEKSCRKNQHTYFTSSNLFSKIVPFEITCKNTV